MFIELQDLLILFLPSFLNYYLSFQLVDMFLQHLDLDVNIPRCTGL